MRTWPLIALCALTLSCAAGWKTSIPLGRPLPISAQTLDGQAAPLSGPGPVRLVALWASWCEPCHKARPVLQRVLDRHPEVRGLAVSVDEDREALLADHARQPMPGVVLHAPTALSVLGTARIPIFLALDRRGRVVDSWTGVGPGLEPALERMLATAEAVPYS
jgi:thiol-disulfide isomerase/thioredoxin